MQALPKVSPCDAPLKCDGTLSLTEASLSASVLRERPRQCLLGTAWDLQPVRMMPHQVPPTHCDPAESCVKTSLDDTNANMLHPLSQHAGMHLLASPPLFCNVSSALLIC